VGVFVPERLGCYRANPDGITAQWGSDLDKKWASLASSIEALRIALYDEALERVHPALARKLVELSLSAGRLAVRSRQPSRVLEALRWSMEALVGA
jgi:hypothetical protein